MSMFGWGMGDIIAISRLAVKVYTAYKDAPGDYRNISDEVESLQILIDKAAPYFDGTTLNSNSRQEGQKALKGCRNVLEDLNSLIEKYNSSASSGTSQVLKRIKLGTEDIASLRVRLISNTTLLNGFIQSCESREIRQMQEQILGLHRTTSRSSITSFAGSLNTKMAYKRFCKNLFQIGVTPEMITQKEGEILNIFNQQHQVTATGDEGSDGGNTGIADESQPLRPNSNQPRFRLPIDFLVGPRMLVAAMAGDTKRFITALEYIRNIDFKDELKETALHKAAGGGHMNIAQLLLHKGASTEATNNDNNTPLHLAARDGHTSTVELLLQKGASTGARNNDNITPLHFASASGYTSMVELLLQNGAPTEASNRSESTPLHLAAASGHTSAVALLLQKSASTKARNNENNTALHLAAGSGHTSIVELLLQNGAPKEARNNLDSTPLHLATENGHTRMVELLLEKGASMEARSLFEKTLLHLAAENGRTSMVELLIQKGAPTQARKSGDNTPLHYAAWRGHTDTVKLLLEKGASIDAKNWHGHTPLYYAEEKGHTDTAILLKTEAAKLAAHTKLG